ncbi:MAG TPA: hypothetical protein VGM70_12500 [Pseudolysinimonas sp.]
MRRHPGSRRPPSAINAIHPEKRSWRPALHRRGDRQRITRGTPSARRAVPRPSSCGVLVVSIVSALGEVAERSQLIARGVRPREISAAIRRGAIVRVRRGWFATATASDEQMAAVRIGGRLGGMTACATFGLWVPESAAIHISLSRNSSRLRASPVSGRPIILDWASDRPQIHPARPAWRVDVGTAIAQSIRVLAPDEAVAMLDSALHHRLISGAMVGKILQKAPQRVRAIGPMIDSRAESGIESLVRVRLQQRGITSLPQIEIPGVGRVDLLIGDRLVLEVDGRGFHSSTDDFAHDRERDLTSAALGFRVIRLSYRQVITDWPSSEAAILAVIDAGEHRASRRISG